MTNSRLLYLLEHYQAGTATPLELKEFDGWYESLDQQHGPLFIPGSQEAGEFTSTKLQELKEKLNIEDKPAPVTKLLPVRRLWPRLAVAASILFIIGLGTYFVYFNKHTSNNHQLVVKQIPDVEAPRVTKAVITLANGSTVALDSLASGTLARQGNVKLVKVGEGQLIYDGTHPAGEGPELSYNTLFNPKGSQVVSLTLNDGTKVWLNSESSLRYPVAFAGVDRKVEISGEAYFEVAKDASKKFIVSLPFPGGDAGEVEVLGTHFNVNSYVDESAVKVTLLEGSVKVSKSGQAVTIKPGAQAVLADHLRLTTHNAPDLEQVMAWKNGMFRLRETSIAEIMRQVSRWYDVEVEYRGNTGDLTFYGAIGRKENVSQLLKIMELTGAVSFKIEGKKIIVNSR